MFCAYVRQVAQTHANLPDNTGCDGYDREQHRLDYFNNEWSNFTDRPTPNLGGRTGKILRPSSVALKSKNQEINRLHLAVKLPWAFFFESVDILS
ncbi:hypothetical protein TNCV_1175841 [Trichonephila clavipes]|nr:hypothetical protein TNCV_1175841 [Trichonephila clavipes]